MTGYGGGTFQLLSEYSEGGITKYAPAILSPCPERADGADDDEDAVKPGHHRSHGVDRRPGGAGNGSGHLHGRHHEDDDDRSALLDGDGRQ